MRIRSFRLVLSLVGLLVLVGGAAPQRGTRPSVLLLGVHSKARQRTTRALEIYNGTGARSASPTGGYSVAMYFSGGTTAGLTIFQRHRRRPATSGSSRQATASPVIPRRSGADERRPAGTNGRRRGRAPQGRHRHRRDRPVRLRPRHASGAPASTGTGDNTLRRKATIEAGDPVGSDACRARRAVGRLRDRHLRRPRHPTAPARPATPRRRSSDLAREQRERRRA